MLDVRRMRVLREVAVQGSFSAAAEALSFTQSAVSQQIAALERETGTILVQRSARGVRLTEAGEALVRHADAVLCPPGRGRGGARGDRRPARRAPADGRLRVRRRDADAARDRATSAPSTPAIELSMTLGEPEETEPQLKSGELDLVLGFGSRFAQEDGVERHFLLEDPMLLVLPREHPLANKRNLRLRRPRRRGVDRRPAGLRVQPPDLRRLLGRGLRPADRVRDRRLRRRAGLRRRGRRRVADRRARADDDPRRHRRARPRPRDARAQDLRGRLRRLPHARDGARCSRCCRRVAASYESRRPRLSLVG